MAPLPKKKHSQSRTKTRKAARKLSIPHLVTCPNCGNLKYPHRACPNCGLVGLKKDEKKERPKT